MNFITSLLPIYSFNIIEKENERFAFTRALISLNTKTINKRTWETGGIWVVRNNNALLRFSIKLKLIHQRICDESTLAWLSVLLYYSQYTYIIWLASSDHSHFFICFDFSSNQFKLCTRMCIEMAISCSPFFNSAHSLISNFEFNIVSNLSILAVNSIRTHWFYSKSKPINFLFPTK